MLVKSKAGQSFLRNTVGFLVLQKPPCALGPWRGLVNGECLVGPRQQLYSYRSSWSTERSEIHVDRHWVSEWD